MKNYKYRWLEAAMGDSCLTAKDKNVAWVLFKHANEKLGHYAYPNMTTIDAEIGGSGVGKNIGRHIEKLIKAGWISKAQRVVDSGRLSNGYYLKFDHAPHPEEQTPQSEHDAPHPEHQTPQSEQESPHSEGVTLYEPFKRTSLGNSLGRPEGRAPLTTFGDAVLEDQGNSSWLENLSDYLDSKPSCLASQSDELHVVGGM